MFTLYFSFNDENGHRKTPVPGLQDLFYALRTAVSMVSWDIKNGFSFLLSAGIRCKFQTDKISLIMMTNRANLRRLHTFCNMTAV